MAPTAAYDEIADWYEREFLARTEPGTDPLGIDAALRDLLDPGLDPGLDQGLGPEGSAASGPGLDQGLGPEGSAASGPGLGPEVDQGLGPEGGAGSAACLEIGCGTGIRAARVRELGWTPVGIDISGAMLRHARARLPVLRADAALLPFKDGCLPAVVAVMAHTDMPAYPAVLREAARVLRPGGLYVHVGVHPCFCGGFADRSDPQAAVIQPGYLDGYWTKASWTDQGIRDKVGATHMPLPRLFHAFTDAGLVLERFAEGGEPIPTVLAIRARKSRP